MTDVTDLDPDRHDKIEQVDLQLEMQRSYLDYAMSVIVGRALPDVRDGLKPVHRRVIYAMYDGGYRPDRAFSKCTRIIGDVMGQFHPHGDSSVYDALVRLVQPWSLRYPLALGQGNFGSPGNDGAAAHRYTETKMAPLAMEMVRDIDEDTVDLQDNYDGRTQEPTVLPGAVPEPARQRIGRHRGRHGHQHPAAQSARGGGGRAVGARAPDAPRDELLEALIQRVKGPDFPTGAQILGVKGIQDAYRTGRGSITMRAVVNVEEVQGRTSLVVTELPYQVNPDNLAIKIADLVKDGKLAGIADIRDESSGRTGQRLVIVLKRDAVAKVVLNNLYKHTQLQENFGANMLAIVDGVPRTLALDGFITHWIDHQIEVIVRRTTFRLAKAEADAHIQRGYVKALDALDEVIALIRRSPDVDEARTGLIKLLKIDELQADAILALQLRRLAALERQKIQDRLAELELEIAGYQAILQSEVRQRDDRHRGAHRARRQVRRRSPHRDHARIRRRHERRGPDPRRGDGHHHHPRRVHQAHPQRQLPVAAPRRPRASRAPSCAPTTSSSTSSSRPRTTGCCSSRTPAASTAPRRTRSRRRAATPRDSTSRTCSPCNRTKRSRRCSTSGTTRRPSTSRSPPAAGWSRRRALTEYDTNRTGGIIAINLREGDEVVSAMLVEEDSEILLVSRKGMSLRFVAKEAIAARDGPRRPPA